MMCRDMGGPCDFKLNANTAEEMAKKGGEHAMAMKDEAHIKLGEKIKNMSPDENVKWMREFTEKWDKVPEEKIIIQE